MSIKYEDLNPRHSSFTLNNKDYEIRPFDLAAQVWARNEFATSDNKDGIVVLTELIQDMNNPMPLFKCVWHLLKRKRDFGFYEEFVKAIEKGDNDSDKFKIMSEMWSAFLETLGLSQPQLESIREEMELKKSQAAVS